MNLYEFRSVGLNAHLTKNPQNTMDLKNKPMTSFILFRYEARTDILGIKFQSQELSGRPCEDQELNKWPTCKYTPSMTQQRIYPRETSNSMKTYKEGLMPQSLNLNKDEDWTQRSEETKYLISFSIILIQKMSLIHLICI
jgi:hypothetical protein